MRRSVSKADDCHRSCPSHGQTGSNRITSCRRPSESRGQLVLGTTEGLRKPDALTKLRSSLLFQGVWFPRKNIRPSALILYFRRVRLPLDDLFNAKPRNFYALSDCPWLKKQEIHRDRPPTQLLLLKNLITRVKGKQQQPTWFQYSGHFPKHQG